jgi:hypothetical protein
VLAPAYDRDRDADRGPRVRARAEVGGGPPDPTRSRRSASRSPARWAAGRRAGSRGCSPGICGSEARGQAGAPRARP